MDKIKTFLKNNWDIVFFILVLEIKLYAYGIHIEENYFSFALLFWPILASILILASISLLFPSTIRRRVLYGFNVIVSLLIVSDIVYYGYFRDILCIPVLKNGIMLGPVKSSVVSLFKPVFLLFFLDLLLLPILYKKFSTLKSWKVKTRIAAFAALFIFSCSVNGYKIYRLSVDQPRLLTTMYNRIYIAKQLGDFNFHILDTYNFLNQQIQSSKSLPVAKEAEIKTYLANNAKAFTGNNLTGAGKGKNLIILQVEALQGFAINTKVNGVEVTPNLNRWLKKSAYFDNYFYQVAAGNTSDAEFMTNNSLFPAPEGAVAYLYYGNTFASLPKALEKEDYYTATMHGFKEDYWNRSVMNKTEGYNTFYGAKSYNINEQVGLGLSDKSFLTQSLEKIKKLPQPYFSFLITLSSHYPFDDEKHYGDFNVGEFQGTLLGNYLKAIHYTDAQLGMFLDALSENGTLDNSIVMLYGDHYAMPKQEQGNVNKLLNLSDSSDLAWMQLQKVPMLIHFPEDKNAGVNHLYSGEVDLYPTVANLFDLPKQNLLGKDLFNSTAGNVIFRNGSFTDGNVFYLSQSNNYFDVKSVSSIPETPELKQEKDLASTKLEYSDDILKHDLLKKFSGASK